MRRDERRYSDKEVGKILRNAAQRQGSGGPGDNSGGMTLGELQRVAAEVNIDPEHILAAAADLDREAPTPPGMLGLSTIVHEEHIIEGEVDDAAWEGIVAQLRSTLGAPGEATRLGSAYEWMAKFEGGTTVHLSASPRNGRTTIQLTAEYGQLVFLTMMISGIASLMASALIGKGMTKAGAPGGAIVLAVILAILAVVTIAYLVLRTWHQANRRKLDSLMKRITSTAANQGSSPAASSTVQPEWPEHHVQA
jgi:hypothetical protein